MSIEFRCHSCQRLLRTQDDTAGKKAQCPGCGAVVPIPLPSPPAPPAWPRRPQEPTPAPAPAAPPPIQAPARPAAEPAAKPWSTPAPLPPPSRNPYESPSMAAYSKGLRGPEATGDRNGPAWERDGASYRSFVETIKESYGNISEFFATMRRDGGLAAPLGFGFIGSLISLAASLLWFALIVAISMFAPANANDAGTMALGMVVIAVGGAIVVPLVTVLVMFLTAGMYHVMLMLMGGANQTYETTFRVVAYSMGTTSLLQFIPCCGGGLAGIVSIVFMIIGLANAHETTGVRAAAAVLLPVAFCCGMYVAANIGLAMLGPGGKFN